MGGSHTAYFRVKRGKTKVAPYLVSSMDNCHFATVLFVAWQWAHTVHFPLLVVVGKAKHVASILLHAYNGPGMLDQ